ncbi:MAG: YtxH domain-containing protein [Vicinamibacterales bacterium]
MRYSNEGGMGGGMFLLGAIAGAMVGAGVALLVAPKSGAETRQDLNESFNSLREVVARRYREMADRAGVEFENLEEKADQLADQLESSAREALDVASSKMREANKSVRDGANAFRQS